MKMHADGAVRVSDTVRGLGLGAFGERNVGRPIWRMGVRARQFGGRPCDWPGCAASADPSVSFAHGFCRVVGVGEGSAGEGDPSGVVDHKASMDGGAPAPVTPMA